MSNVIQFPKGNIKYATDEQLRKEWDMWADIDGEECLSAEYHYEQIHAELNRRGLGKYCAV